MTAPDVVAALLALAALAGLAALLCWVADGPAAQRFDDLMNRYTDREEDPR